MATLSKPKVILLTGAPLSDELDWSESTLLPARAQEEVSFGTTSTTSIPRWRTVTSIVPQLQAFHEDGENTVFLATDGENAAQETSRDFLEHLVSQLPLLTSQAIDDSTADVSFESFYSALSDAHDESKQDRSLPTPPTRLAMTDLKKIPNAAHLLKIAPQTMTVNIMVGVIAVQPSRTVQIRRSKLYMEIIEVLVGDESRSGFSITVWLPPRSSASAWRTTVSNLKPGDLLLISTLALSVFNGSVYGQTLNRGPNLSTKLWLLESIAPPPELKEKINRVKTWRDRFVGAHQPHSGKEQLPPETQ